MMEYMNQEEKTALGKEIANQYEWPEKFIDEKQAGEPQNLEPIVQQKLHSLVAELQKKGYSVKDITKALTKSSKNLKQSTKTEGR